MVDLDGGGSVDFEEFLLWYIRYFYTPSGKNDNSTLSPIQVFYSKLGNARLRDYQPEPEVPQTVKRREGVSIFHRAPTGGWDD